MEVGGGRVYCGILVEELLVRGHVGIAVRMGRGRGGGLHLHVGLVGVVDHLGMMLLWWIHWTDGSPARSTIIHGREH